MDTDFKEIYAKYYGIVRRYMLSLTKDDDLAEEMTQEAFYKALRSIDKYDPSQKMLTWLCAIAKNTYFSYCKKRRMYAEIDDNTPDGEGDIIDRMIDSESGLIALQALHRLGEPYKEVFTLRSLGGLSFARIAEVFAKSESWARVTYFRAKNQIRDILKEGDTQDEQ